MKKQNKILTTQHLNDLYDYVLDNGKPIFSTKRPRILGAEEYQFSIEMENYSIFLLNGYPVAIRDNLVMITYFINNTILPIVVNESNRLSTLPKYFGNKCIQFESLVFAYIKKFYQNYKGGLWEFIKLSNGGFYIFPKSEDNYNISVNYFDGIVTNEVLGLICTLYAINTLCYKYEDDKLINLYYKVRDYALEHKFSSSILQAID